MTLENLEQEPNPEIEDFQEPQETPVESGEPELEGEFELELEGEPEPSQQYTPEEVLVHKLAKQRKRAQSAEGENEELKKRLAELESRISPPPTSHSDAPSFPQMYEDGIETKEQYDAAIKKWWADMDTYQNRHKGAETANQNAKEEYRKRIEGYTKSVAGAAAKFASENKISVDRVADALNTATSEIDEATGVEGSMVYLLDSVGEGKDRVGFYLGTNETAREQLKGLLRKDPNGLSAIAHMTRLAEKLKPKQRKQVSRAPEPDESLKGDADTTIEAKKLQEQYDKEEDFSKLVDIRRKARALGITLKT